MHGEGGVESTQRGEVVGGQDEAFFLSRDVQNSSCLISVRFWQNALKTVWYDREIKRCLIKKKKEKDIDKSVSG